MHKIYRFTLVALLLYLIQNVSSITVHINVHDTSEVDDGCARECILYNDKYSGEYLYAGLTISSLLRRSVYSWSPQVANVHNDRHEYTFCDDDKKGVWYFEPVSCDNGVFYLRNKEYDEYLYASDFHYSFMHDRRKIYTWKKVNNQAGDLDDSFKWRITKVDNGNEEKYLVQNLKFNEPLYAAGFFFRRDSVRRNVYSWSGHPDSNQFNWLIKCRDGQRLINKK
jgi:hypothetical protein